jgi:hypothetical protein
LHDLIKDALVPSATRQANEGSRPVYGYDFRAYRRALQIARLRRDGFVEKDAIRIQLFVRGYGERDIRQSLLNQYSKYGKALLAPVRSGYADNSKSIPPGHKSSLVDSLGALDDRLRIAGLDQSDDIYIAALRAAKRPSIAREELEKKWNQSLAIQGKEVFPALGSHLVELFGGQLLFGARGDEQAAGRDEVEQLIFSSSDVQYEGAREFYRLMTYRGSLTEIQRLLRTGADEQAQHLASDVIVHSIRKQGAWSACFLVMGLTMARLTGIELHSQQVRDAFKFIRENNLDIEDLARP